MKKIFLLSILIIGTILNAQELISKEKIEYVITEGQGFGSIMIDTSTLNNIQTILGKGKIVSTTYKYGDVKPNGKKKHTVKTLEYQALGLIFQFQDEKINNSTLKSITFKVGKPWKTSNGLIICKSTRKDVYNLYGNPNHEHYCVGFLPFASHGIAFLFNCVTEKQDSMDDTIKEIMITPKQKD